MDKRVLKVNQADDMIVALTDLKKGENIVYNSESFTMLVNVPAKHKFATQDFKIGEELKMYGVVVGKATQAIAKGELIHTENLKHAADPYQYRGSTFKWNAPDTKEWEKRTFMGYHRADGRVGTANYWLFIPTVFCENRNLDIIRESMHNELGYAVSKKYLYKTKSIVEMYQAGSSTEEILLADFKSPLAGNETKRIFKNIDGIKFLNHQGGCGGTRQDSLLLAKLLAAYANHPNVAGITLLSLGCQHLQVEVFNQALKEINPKFDKPMIVFEQQKSQSEEELLTDAIKQTFVKLIEANKIERKPAPLSKLVVGVKCGGSDGFSGISANPAVGYTSDLLAGIGASVLLAEFPELCGAEQDLIDRAVDEKTARKFIDLMEDYEKQAQAAGSGFFMNPSPGNIKDGLITDAIKSTGAAKKGGTSPVTDVLDYAEQVKKPGLNLVCTPGNDVEATTGKAASGATLILFTTGLGTPTGNPVCPVIKVATNSELANRMSDIIDIDTGAIIRGEKNIEEMGKEMLEYCIRAASGEVIPKAVLLGQDDFIPWKRGVSL